MLTDLYAPVIGGLEIHVRNLSAGLAARGHTVTVATLDQGNAPARESDAQGVAVRRIRGTLQRAARLFSDSQRQFAPPFPDPEATLALRRIIAEVQPEIIHAHNWLLHSYLPLQRRNGPKIILSLHDYGLVCARRDRIHQGELCDGPGARKCLACATAHYGAARGVPTAIATRIAGVTARARVDQFLPVSAAVAQGNLLRDGRDPFRIVPNFIPDDVAAVRGDYDRYLEQLPREPFLLFVGALIPIKGIAVLLRAYSTLADAPPLVVIGARWPTSPTTFPPGVTVLEDWPHGAVMAAWRRSLLGIVPSIWADPCPTVALEAMAVGRPMVASRIGGLSDIVADGETGLLVRPGDANALAAALRAVYSDPTLADRFGAAGEARVRERFVASAVIPQIEAIYRQVLGAATTPEAERVTTLATGDRA